MTSQVSREQVEDELARAGVRDRFTLARIMRTIDLYALATARRQEVFTRGDLPPDMHYWLLPGQWDKNGKVTRCLDCKRVKSWSPHFHLDESHPSRHKITCKACLRKSGDRYRSAVSRGGWLCPACHERKPTGEFPQEKMSNPRKPVKCNSCSEGKTSPD